MSKHGYGSPRRIRRIGEVASAVSIHDRDETRLCRPDAHSASISRTTAIGTSTRHIVPNASANRIHRDSPFTLCFGAAYDPVMTKTLLLSAAAFSLCTSSLPCVAQEVASVIYLSTGESAKARQTAQDLTSAQDRNNRAATAWRNFHQSYQAAHPELSGLRFASDFRVAFAQKNISSAFPFDKEAATVELSAEERQKAESLHREMLEARRALDQAQKNWSDYWYQLVVDHVSPSLGGVIVTLPGGKSATIPSPWGNGVVFTPDFRVAVPR